MIPSFVNQSMNRSIVPYSENLAFDALIDARTPEEFALDHLPGAINLPVLTHAERTRIGTLYAQSPFLGRLQGATAIARNIADHIEQSLSRYPQSWKPLIYCWRGGKRSSAFVHILRQIGWDAHQLQGGYKSYRQWVCQALAEWTSDIKFVVLCGATGVGKSALIEALSQAGAQVLHLEALAEHRGSILGNINGAQPSQKLFENRLYQSLRALDRKRVIFVEAESKRIGRCHCPTALMQAIRSGVTVRIEASMSARVGLVLHHYRQWIDNPLELSEKIKQLAPFHSQQTLSRWHTFIEQKNWEELVAELMDQHYDPCYRRSLAKNFQMNQSPVYTWQHSAQIPQLAQTLIRQFYE